MKWLKCPWRGAREREKERRKYERAREKKREREEGRKHFLCKKENIKAVLNPSNEIAADNILGKQHLHYY